ncbi:hypothetical protein NQ317_010852 [Molorchus minor]|uniref:HEAT repeat-containing protein 5B n=1 Tax=Molorchus minor TaxID=1323400 RepID=A0ABQ9JYX7_9CUCU|nr:hypothetical protein NQ317_010852 [Molorchus minor]
MQMTKGKSDFLALHLSDLIRMAFIAATSDSDPLRLEGLKTLQDIIEKFAKVPEPEFPGHLLLEQFQAQVGAALRPAFSPNTSSLVTAAACEVCSTWIGSNVVRDLNDLKRVHQLLVSSLTKLQTKNSMNQLYNESLSTLEKLAILKAWAEVYIVAMKANESLPVMYLLNSSNNNNEFNDFEHSRESLLTLVQPELVSLSQYWLAALRDHALLSLPCEFSSQLPHDGGAFYTNETMESARPYYVSSWPPILHAAALWLNSENFTDAKSETSDDNALNNNKSFGSSSDKFHLLFGICMEALCSPHSVEPLESIITCLQALYTLLDTEYSRHLLISNRLMAIELCNVLHRLILTRDNHVCQLLCLEVLKQIIKAAREELDQKEKSKTVDDTETDIPILGEGGETGKLIPGKSLVFAVLEVCLCILIRQLPSLSPSPNLTLVNSLRLMQSSKQSGQLLAASVTCMEGLHRLCSPKGAISILPTVLYLTTGLIKEVASKNINDVTILANNPAIQAALRCLKILATDPYSKHQEIGDNWQKLLQSALAKTIDLAKTGSEETKLDEVTMMLTIAVFVLHAPSKVVTAPSLQYPCINHLRQCLENPNPLVRLKCVKTLKSLFAHQDRTVATPYIHTLAPQLVEFLYSDSAKKLYSEDELSVTVETIVTVESLIELAEPHNRIQMLTLLVPVLVSYLLVEPNATAVNKYSQSLHEVSLQWLMKIGPKYGQEFKKLMTQMEGLRIKLETAVRSSQLKHNKTKNSASIMQPTSCHTPTIKLKTDFSNFS